MNDVEDDDVEEEEEEEEEEEGAEEEEESSPTQSDQEARDRVRAKVGGGTPSQAKVSAPITVPTGKLPLFKLEDLHLGLVEHHNAYDAMLNIVADATTKTPVLGIPEPCRPMFYIHLAMVVLATERKGIKYPDPKYFRMGDGTETDD